MMIDPSKIDVAAMQYRLPTPAPEAMMTDLAHVEAVLEERALKLGVEIRRSTTVTDLTQYDDHVAVRAGDTEYTARWLIGTDGGRSTVRRLAGFEFVGTEPLFTGYTISAELDDPTKLNPGFNPTPHGMYVAMRVPGHIGVLDFDGGANHRTSDLT